jgi:NO-binding membrane sensor protein with MHYT domain
LLDYSHNHLFVLASLAIAVIAGFSGLSLVQGASQMSVPVRKIVVSIAAVILGSGIWSMHFVAMLGLELPVAYYFDPLITLISALTAILFMGLALLIVHFGTRTRSKILLAGVIMGSGIAAMHYIGMSGMELCLPSYSAPQIVIAFAASIALSMASFQVSYGQRSARNILLGTVGFGVAVFAVHFIAMAGTGFTQSAEYTTFVPPMSRGVLAFGVTLSAFVLSGSFLLSGVTFATHLGGAGSDGKGERAPDPAPDGLGPSAETPAQSLTAQAEPVCEGRIPYEADSRTHFISPANVSAIRAEGHYTVLYAGENKLFCPWSISEAETRIGSGSFVRTHRSYLVNLDHVTSFERKKDNGVCYFDETPALPKVPVSRSRLADVRTRLGM